jgi:amino acid transporter
LELDALIVRLSIAICQSRGTTSDTPPSIYATGPLIGFDASGHTAEETKNASTAAARGIFTSAIASGTCGLLATILFLFVTPNIDVWMTLTAPQPFVQVRSVGLSLKNIYKGQLLICTVFLA